jgi:transglutaminase-like putative cysteine protease
MTRLAFRERVDSPRPRSAIAMVALATISLASTGQIAPPALLAAAIALTVATFSAEPAAAWRRSPWLLNLGLAGAMGAGLALWLHGTLAMVALAHFAVLAQGLQLLDARPRRSEFLLVALAVFQVILAANMTDSLLFPILLVAFTVSVVWTLIVHTLRAEALEAGEPEAARRVITTGLRRTVVFASLLMTLLALVLFPVLPRIRTGAFLSGGLGGQVPMAGFSEQVELGDLGRIRLDPSIVMRVETLQGPELPAAARYWRGLAFDHFDGRSWSVTPPTKTRVPGSAEIGIWLSNAWEGPNLVQRILREPMEGGVLFGMEDTRQIQGSIRHLERDLNGGLYAANQAGDRVRYTVSGRREHWTDAQLRTDVATTPRENRGSVPDADGGSSRYLQLPPLSDAVYALARTITAGAETDADRVRAIEQYLLKNGRYSDTPPVVDPASTRSPLEAFLFDGMEAHCEYYASALVILARSVGIPARLVNGFAGGRENKLGGFVEIARTQAHAWAEVHYEHAGWVRYDATPPDLRYHAEAALALRERIRQVAAAVEYWWFQRVVGFDRSDQLTALRRTWLAWRNFSNAPGSAPRARRSTRGGGISIAAGSRKAVLAALGLAACIALLWRIRAARAQRALPDYYDQALRALERRGLKRNPAAAARDFAQTSRDALPAPAAAAFARLTESYLRERFGGRPPAAAARDLRDLRRALRGSSRTSATRPAPTRANAAE